VKGKIDDVKENCWKTFGQFKALKKQKIRSTKIMNTTVDYRATAA
jgi:hypothetical protein